MNSPAKITLNSEIPNSPKRKLPGRDSNGPWGHTCFVTACRKLLVDDSLDLDKPTLIGHLVFIEASAQEVLGELVECVPKRVRAEMTAKSEAIMAHATASSETHH